MVGGGALVFQQMERYDNRGTDLERRKSVRTLGLFMLKRESWGRTPIWKAGAGGGFV